ncbi:MAG: PQQ-binding-like beta-propeller repeat protein [Pirellulales bacterium]
MRCKDKLSISIHLAAIAWMCLLLNSVSAGDWPQILGPQRNGRADNESLAEAWPAAGPKSLWRHEVGGGFAGVAVAGDACIVFHRRGDQAIAERLDAVTGQPQWKQSFPTYYVSTIAPDNGPRCVPLIHDDCVYLFGADGDLHALALADGQPRWTRELYRECKSPSGYFGAGSSPIVEGELLLVNVGGKDGHGLVALDRNSGKSLWHKTDEQASYSSPVAATIGDQRHVVFVTRLNVVSVDPRTGAEQFRFPFGMRGPTVNAANPLILGDRLFVTASYGVGARLANISATGVESVWENDDAISSQYTTPIEHDGFLYGIHGRQDAGVAELRCVDLATGTVRWSQPDFGTGNLIVAGDKLLIQKTSGELVLAKIDPERFIPLATARVFPAGSVVQALPALASGRLYVRDESELAVVEVGK